MPHRRFDARTADRLLRGATLLTAGLLLGLGGCRSPFDASDGYRDLASTERLRAIDRIDLEARSTAPPVSIDDAASDPETLAFVAGAPTGGTLPLTLEEARAAALENNLDLRVQLIAPTIAATSIDEAEARFESTFRGSFRRSGTDRPVAVATEGSQSDSVIADVGWNLPLRSGGNIDLRVPMSRTSTNNPFSLLDPAASADATFSITQPLLRNAGTQTNTHAIRVARYRADITDTQTKLEAIRVLAAADRAYWSLYAAQRALDVSLKQYQRAQEQLERAKNRVRLGADPEIEVLRAESGLAAQVEAIIVSQSAIRRAERDVKRIMNRPDLPVESPVALELVSGPDPVGLELDPSSLYAEALDQRMEMLEFELQLAIDASTIDLERNAALPLVVLDYTYSLGGLGSTYRDAFGQIGSHRFEDWSVGVRAEIPVGNEAARSRVHRAILERLQRLATREQRRLAIKQEIYDTVDRLAENWQRILAARREAILAGRTYEGEQRQFNVGTRTSTDVLDAATRLAEAQIAEIRALTDYQITQVDIAVATGTLLGYGRVRWEPFADEKAE